MSASSRFGGRRPGVAAAHVPSGATLVGCRAAAVAAVDLLAPGEDRTVGAPQRGEGGGCPRAMKQGVA